MYQNDEPMKGKRMEGDILFSRAVKAGKRVYYLDVKHDRRGEYYISLTESKRLKDQGDALHPVFERHKIFLYREDLEKFVHAFAEVADYMRENAPVTDFTSDWNVGTPADESETPKEQDGGEGYKFNVDF